MTWYNKILNPEETPSFSQTRRKQWLICSYSYCRLLVLTWKLTKSLKRRPAGGGAAAGECLFTWWWAWRRFYGAAFTQCINIKYHACKPFSKECNASIYEMNNFINTSAVRRAILPLYLCNAQSVGMYNKCQMIGVSFDRLGKFMVLIGCPTRRSNWSTKTRITIYRRRRPFRHLILGTDHVKCNRTHYTIFHLSRNLLYHKAHSQTTITE